MRTKRNNYFCVLIILLVLIEITSIFLMYKSSNNRNTLLDNVNLKEEIKNMKGIAIMLEQDDGTYKESSTNTFPTDMKFNSELSGCIDNLGNKIANTLTYENGIANVTTDNTSYCYLYFDILPKLLYERILMLDEESDIGLQQEYIEGDDLYRFSGINGNDGIYNYICLGTDSCSSGDDNMYRIIGINPYNGEVKVIKQTAIPFTSSEFGPADNSGSDATWLESAIRTTVQDYYDTLSFKDMITSHMWGYGDVINNLSDKTQILNDENSVSVEDYFGILSLSDYYLAYKENRNWQDEYDTNNWIHLANNGFSSMVEWTMIRPYSQNAYIINTDGYLGAAYITGNNYYMRPTFYLSNDVMYVDGTGTLESPYIIS